MKATIVLISSSLLVALAVLAGPAQAQDSHLQDEIQACMHKSAGEACSYNWADYTVVSGSCLNSPDKKLVCAMADVSEPPAAPARVNPDAFNTQGDVSPIRTHAAGGVKGKRPTEATPPEQATAGVEIAPYFLGSLRWP